MIDIFGLTEHHVYKGGELASPNQHGYQYLMAGNGLFLRARNRFVDTLQMIASANVRGLPVLMPFVRLRTNKLPGRLLTAMVTHAGRFPEKEIVYQTAVENGKFKVHVVAFGNKTSVEFDDICPADQILFEAHSHNTMDAFFSGTDNAFEQHFRWYAVLGRVTSERPQVALRLGVYGYHFPIRLSELFDLRGDEGVTDVTAVGDAMRSVMSSARRQTGLLGEHHVGN